MVAAVALALMTPAASSPTTAQSVSGRAVAPPAPDEGGAGLQVDQQTLSVKRAKVQFVLPRFYFRGSLWACIVNSSGDVFVTDPAGIATSNPEGCPKELQTLPQLPGQYPRGYSAGRVLAYVVSTPGPRPTYGSLPEVRVTALAFGSIPVSAKVHLRQSSTNGLLDPLVGEHVETNGLIAGEPSYPGFARTPQPIPSSDGFPIKAQLVIRTAFEGRFDTRLSDVTVDGRAVDVGNRCVTKTPSRLVVNEPRGFFYPGASDSQRAKRGTPGAFTPIINPPSGYFDGTVNIPAFTGCGEGKNNIDVLLTSFLSAQVNRVSGYVPDSILKPWCDFEIARCGQAQARAERKLVELRDAVASGASPAVIRRLQAKIPPHSAFNPKISAKTGKPID